MKKTQYLIKNLSQTQKRGFSLIELAAVIAILAILAVIIVPSFLSYNERSRAQKDVSAMDEVVNAVQLAMADGKCFDEMLLYSCSNNYLTYTDSSGTYGRQSADAEFWAADGEGKATTITFNPKKQGSSKTSYEMDEAILNDMTYGNGSTAEKREMQGNQLKNNQCYWKNSKTIDGQEAGFTYKRVRSSIGQSVNILSQTYRNSSFTIFIHFKQVDGTTIADVYGAFNGTNLYQDAPSSNGSGDHLIDPETGNSKPGGITESNQTASDLIGSGVLYGNADYKKENINPTYEDGTLSFLHLGNLLNDPNYSSKTIIFTDVGTEEGADVSQERNKSILAWKRDETLFVSATKAGQNIKVPNQCVAGFSGNKYPGYQKVEYIQLRPLDVSEVENMGQMFMGFGKNADNITIDGFAYWNTEKVKSMTEMFAYLGDNCPGAVVINGLEGLDTQNVTSMYKTFYYFCSQSPTVINIDGVSQWDTGRVTTMENMFYKVGERGVERFVIDLSKWDVSKVTNFSHMFYRSGVYKAKTWDVGNLNNWDVSSAKTFEYMFMDCGFNAETWNIGKLNNWKTHKATNFTAMFARVAAYVKDWSIGDLSNWNTSNATHMAATFFQAGPHATNWYVGDLGQWNVSKVRNMTEMFHNAGYKSQTFTVGDLSNWDVSSVTKMKQMFFGAGAIAREFDLGDLSRWDVSNVQDMSYMFAETGGDKNTTRWHVGKLDNWDVSSVTNMDRMFYAAAYRTKFDVGNLDNWNVSKVTNMSAMFSFSGSNGGKAWGIGDLSNWDVSSVTNMSDMFYAAGQGSNSFVLGDISKWNVSNVKNMSRMFGFAGYFSKSFNIGDISKWNVGNVEDFSTMFSNCAYSATYSLDLTNWNVRSKKCDDFALKVESKIKY